MLPAAHVEVELTLLPSAQGGRKTYVASGYRPQFHYAGKDWDAIFSFDVERVEPGDSVRAVVKFLSPEAHRGKISEGTQFELREGLRVVGRGKVTRVTGL